MTLDELKAIAAEIAAACQAIPCSQDGAHRNQRRKLLESEMNRIAPEDRWQVRTYIRQFTAQIRASKPKRSWHQSNTRLFFR